MLEKLITHFKDVTTKKWQVCVRRAYHVTSHVMFITNDKDHVKSGQDCRHEVDVLGTLRVVPATVDSVGRSEYRAARVECCRDTSLVSHRVPASTAPRSNSTHKYILHLRFSGVFLLTLCAIQIYLLTYLHQYNVHTSTCNVCIFHWQNECSFTDYKTQKYFQI